MVTPASRRRHRCRSLAAILIAAFTAVTAPAAQPAAETPAKPEVRRWLAGDHHIHSRYSVSYDPTVSPPRPIIAGDAIYPISTNAAMARNHGLAWMVATDHGGPLHSKLNRDVAYPELVESRQAVPEVIQFFGMEFDTPGADHSSIIIPHTHDEADRLHELESRFSKREPFPADPSRDTEPKMIEALTHMKGMAHPPIVFAHHPSRSARGPNAWGLTSAAELRGWNDAAPNVAVGMEGAPGHQAATLEREGNIGPGKRGGYGNYPTLGGYDQMTARLGGFWDSLLGEGRRWWITATSDSHKHWREGGSDFWPGEYSKTYVHALKTHDDILDGLRSGRIFVTTGDLISELYVTVSTGLEGEAHGHANIGETLVLPAPLRNAVVTIRFKHPSGPNVRGLRPRVARVDLILGAVTGKSADPHLVANPSTRVERRFEAAQWTEEDGFLTIRHALNRIEGDFYVRVRGTNSAELEPAIDPDGEDPWSDLWFYSNPIFVQPR